MLSQYVVSICSLNMLSQYVVSTCCLYCLRCMHCIHCLCCLCPCASSIWYNCADYAQVAPLPSHLAGFVHHRPSVRAPTCLGMETLGTACVEEQRGIESTAAWPAEDLAQEEKALRRPTRPHPGLMCPETRQTAPLTPHRGRLRSGARRPTA